MLEDLKEGLSEMFEFCGTLMKSTMVVITSNILVYEAMVAEGYKIEFLVYGPCFLCTSVTRGTTHPCSYSSL